MVVYGLQHLPELLVLYTRDTEMLQVTDFRLFANIFLHSFYTETL